MSKKSIVLKYQTPLEFIATYSKKGYEGEKASLEDITKKSLLELITIVAENGSEYSNLLPDLDEFANECGFLYCYEHDIYHEYENCPFCSLGIKMN